MIEKIYLKDIAGYDEEKQEAKKIIEILKNHKEYEKMGAYIPKGLILSGNPGVGKTMLAKAIANESGVPIFEFETNEEESEEATIKSIKELFKKAREHAPSIIFIDELDELVANDDFLSDYSRKTLKILLTEIDGISSTANVMVIATTNHRAKLHPALIRSGRMDKRMTIEMPDYHSREEIFKLYLNKSNLLKNIDTARLASKTADFSGADIKTLINETIIDCKSNNINPITVKDFERNIPVILFQDIRKVNPHGPSDIVCYHEIGHFIAKYKLTNEVSSISTDRFGQVQGYVEFEDDPNPLSPKLLLTRNNLDKKIQIALAGLAAEEVYYGDVCCGASSDVRKAQNYVNNLFSVGAFGFDLTYDHSFERRIYNGHQNDRSETQKAKLEQFVAKKLNTNYEEIKKILIDNKSLATAIFKELKEKRCLDKEQLDIIIKNNN